MSQPFRAGKIIGQSFSISTANGGFFFLIALICLSPALLYEIISILMSTESDLVTDNMGGGRLGSILFGLFGLLASACIIYGVFQQLRGQHFSRWQYTFFR